MPEKLKYLFSKRMVPDIEDRGYQPAVSEMADLIGIPLFDELCRPQQKPNTAAIKFSRAGIPNVKNPAKPSAPYEKVILKYHQL